MQTISSTRSLPKNIRMHSNITQTLLLVRLQFIPTREIHSQFKTFTQHLSSSHVVLRARVNFPTIVKNFPTSVKESATAFECCHRLTLQCIVSVIERVEYIYIEVFYPLQMFQVVSLGGQYDTWQCCCLTWWSI